GFDKNQAETRVVIRSGRRKSAISRGELSNSGEHGLPDMMRELVCRLAAHLRLLDSQAKELEQRIEQWHRQSESSRRLAAIPGIGPITATALVASVGNAHAFENGRQLAAWLGLVPRQHSSGGKPVLLGISKRGDVYLRTLLIHGARAVIAHTERRIQNGTNWLSRLLSRRNRNVAAVALANKNARIVWSLLTSGRDFESGHLSFPVVA
ncbi:IS110 family transposase, partial [Chromobacterium amazonense]